MFAAGVVSTGIVRYKLILLPRPSLPCVIYSSSQRAHSIPISIDSGQVALKALIQIITSSDTSTIRAQSTPSLLLHRRRLPTLQSLSCRLWTIAHWASLSLRCSSSRNLRRPKQCRTRSCILEQARREEPGKCRLFTGLLHDSHTELAATFGPSTDRASRTTVDAFSRCRLQPSRLQHWGAGCCLWCMEGQGRGLGGFQELQA